MVAIGLSVQTNPGESRSKESMKVTPNHHAIGEHGATVAEYLVSLGTICLFAFTILPLFSQTIEDEVKIASCVVGGGTQTSDPAGGGGLGGRSAQTLQEQCEEKVRLERGRDDDSSSPPPGPG